MEINARVAVVECEIDRAMDDIKTLRDQHCEIIECLNRIEQKQARMSTVIGLIMVVGTAMIASAKELLFKLFN